MPTILHDARNLEVLHTSNMSGILCSVLIEIENGLLYLEHHRVRLKKPCKFSLRLSTKCVRYYFRKYDDRKKMSQNSLFLRRNNNDT